MQRSLFSLGLIAGVLSAPLTSQSVVVGGLSLGVATVVRSHLGKFVGGLGLGGLLVGARGGGKTDSRSLPPLALERPVTVRGVLHSPTGLDRWSRYQYRLDLLAIRQGSGVWPMQREASVDADELLQLGSVRIKGYLVERDGELSMQVKDQRLLTLEQSNLNSWLGIRQQVQEWAHRRLTQLITPRTERELLRSLVLGRSDALDPAVKDSFRRLGLGHLFAVSGLHLGILAFLAWAVLSVLSPGLQRLGTVTVILGYSLLLDGQGSVSRAVTVLILWHAAIGIGRKLQPGSALATCVALLLAVDPAWRSDVGLQLSVLAISGILILGVPIAQALPGGWVGKTGAVLVIGASAQAATLARATSLFHWLAPGAPVFSALALPWVASVLALGLLTLATPTWIARWLAIPLTSLLEMGTALRHLAPSTFQGWPITTTSAMLYSLGLVLFLIGIRWRAGVASVSHDRALMICGASLLLWVLIPRDGARVELVLLDVGQGDGLLLRMGERSMLIDGGSSLQGLKTHLAERRIRRLDTLLISHPDYDHCDAARSLVRWVPVHQVWTSAGWDEECYWDLLSSPGPRLVPLWAGRDMLWGELNFRVLSPVAAGVRLDNDDSAVIHLKRSPWGSILLTGDLELRGERKLMRRFPCSELAAEVLKVAHHGSRTSTSRRILDCVAPSTALISAGKDNPFGHPSPEVLLRLDNAGVQIWRTDQEGSVVVPLGSPKVAGSL